MENKILELGKTLGECIAACNYCLNACLHEKDVQMMAKCIKSDKDCAEICSTTLSFMASDAMTAKDLLKLCIESCDACAEECKKHHYDHCQKCAEVCAECADVCRKYV